MLDSLKQKGFDVATTSHAEAILRGDFSQALAELEQVFSLFTLPISELVGSGGGEAQGTQRLRKSLNQLGWVKTTFEIKKTINGRERESQSHEVDHVKVFGSAGVLALEIEWNNKDPFFDRDLENFKRLHGEGAISVGIVVTRGSTLQAQIPQLVLQYATNKDIASFEDVRSLKLRPTYRQIEEVERRLAKSPFAAAWADQFVSDKYGTATTHWAKLQDRIQRGVGNPCPLLLLGIPATVVALDK